MTTDAVFPGLMSKRPLLLKSFVERAEQVFADQVMISYRDGVRHTRTVAETIERARRLASSLRRLGIGIGDRVGTFAWNTQEHLELYLAVPSMGAVLHPVNIRIHADEIRYVVEHAGDRLLFVDASLMDRLPDLSTVEHRVVIDGSASDGVLDYETLIADGDPSFQFPEIPEESASAMCYTSGTTGLPKGVVYSHRSTVLHTLLESLPDLYGFRESDVILPIVPMFHANAWGLPYAAMMVGASMVLPGERTSAAQVAQLIAEEKVTFAAAITTIWHDIARLDDPPDMSSLREAIAGGAPVSETLLRQLDRLGVPVIQGFGMTELNPLLSIGRPPARLTPGTDEWMSARQAQGRPIPLVDVRVDESVGGELQLRGNTVASSYYDLEGHDGFTDDGWIRTGDIVSIDRDGLVRLVDRTKDLIKSGGEWISSVELENALMYHPDVTEATVVAVPDDRWGERPYAFVVLRAGASSTSQDLKQHLRERVAKFWVPDEIEFVGEIVKTSVGKFDKKLLRLAAGEHPHRADRHPGGDAGRTGD